MQDHAPATESGKLRIAGTISSTPRDEIAEPGSISTDQLRPTETAETASQNIIHTDKPIVMKSTEPTHQAINDDTAESNVVFYTFGGQSSLPALIDSGASVSIFLSGYANKLEPSSKRVTGLTDFEIRIYGQTTMTLDLDLEQTVSHNALIANLPEKFEVLG